MIKEKLIEDEIKKSTKKKLEIFNNENKINIDFNKKNEINFNFFTLKEKLNNNDNNIKDLIFIDEKKYTINSLINPNIKKENYLDSTQGEKFFESRQISGSLIPSIIEYFSIFNKKKRNEIIYDYDDLNEEISFYNCLVQILSHSNKKLKKIKFKGFVEAATIWGKTHEDVVKFIIKYYFKECIFSDITNCNPTNKILIDRLIKCKGDINELDLNYLKEIYSDSDFPEISATPDFLLLKKNNDNKILPYCIGEIKCPVNFFYILNKTNIKKPVFSYKETNNYYNNINSNYNIVFKKSKQYNYIQEYYFPQLMLEMLCTGLTDYCLFIIFTLKEIKIFKVFFSKKLCINILKLNLFFYKYYIKPNKKNITLEKIEEIVKNHKSPIDFFTTIEKEIYNNFFENDLKNIKFELYNNQETIKNGTIILKDIPYQLKKNILYQIK